MEFTVQLADLPIDLDAVQTGLLALDPSAVADLDRRRATLRVAGEVGAADIVQLLQQTGCPVTPAHVLEVPAFCCGGCST